MSEKRAKVWSYLKGLPRKLRDDALPYLLIVFAGALIAFWMDDAETRASHPQASFVVFVIAGAIVITAMDLCRAQGRNAADAKWADAFMRIFVSGKSADITVLHKTQPVSEEQP